MRTVSFYMISAQKEPVFRTDRVTHLSFNSEVNGMLCYSGNNTLTVETSQGSTHVEHLYGNVIGFRGSNVQAESLLRDMENEYDQFQAKKEKTSFCHDDDARRQHWYMRNMNLSLMGVNYCHMLNGLQCKIDLKRHFECTARPKCQIRAIVSSWSCQKMQL